MMLRQETDDFEIPDHENNMISFEEVSQNYCVGIVDVVNSTKTIARLSKEQSCTFYSVFLNSVGYIIESNGGKVVKNMGDGILFYFPKSAISDNNVPIQCGKKILEAVDMINNIFKKRKIPAIQYRVSLDYGPIMIAKYATSSCRDIFGPTVNLCAKINHLAKPNQLVIGGDLYQLVKKSKNYKFSDVSVFGSALKHDYSVYSVK
ncbi:MAG: adenylate/guanylate cyclase domain-containing protein [Nitrosopumilus sp.]